MIPDPTNEIRAIRNRLSAACNYDVDKIVDEARRHQAKSGRTYINLAATQTDAKNTTNQRMHPTGIGGRSSS